MLLLHGAAFSTETWNAIGTVDMITSLGVPSVAIGKQFNVDSKSVNKRGVLGHVVMNKGNRGQPHKCYIKCTYQLT